MDGAGEIRSAMARVAGLRSHEAATPGLGDCVRHIKKLQARRFAGTYADLLSGGPYAAPSRFFLDELYSDRDFSARDAQFARIAGAIDRFFPEIVVETSVRLARLHALTEDLDHAMAIEWQARSGAATEAQRYVDSWRAVGRRGDRDAQLSEVLAIGDEMARLTRARGLRTMLRMMRGPAHAAGLDALQRFLESGFDTFAMLARTGQAPSFLRTIADRETALIAMLFDAPAVACETELVRILGQAP